MGAGLERDISVLARGASLTGGLFLSFSLAIVLTLCLIALAPRISIARARAF